MVGAKEKLNFVPWSSEFTIKLLHGSATLKKQKGFTSLILIYEEGSPLYHQSHIGHTTQTVNTGRD